MLAKDGAGETVKVARGLHDLSEMEGVKMNVAVDKGNVYFLQVIIRTNMAPLLIICICSWFFFVLQGWPEHRHCLPGALRSRHGPDVLWQGLWLETIHTGGVADDSFKSTNSPTNSDLIRCLPFLSILWISKKRPVSKQPFRSKLCCPCPSSFFNALFSHRAACRMLTMPGNKFSTRSPECIDSVSRPVWLSWLEAKKGQDRPP